MPCLAALALALVTFALVTCISILRWLPSLTVYRLVMPIGRVGEDIGPICASTFRFAFIADEGAEDAASVIKFTARFTRTAAA